MKKILLIISVVFLVACSNQAQISNDEQAVQNVETKEAEPVDLPVDNEPVEEADEPVETSKEESIYDRSFAPKKVALVEAFDLSFNRPILLFAYEDIFIIDKTGKINMVKDGKQELVFDISSRVSSFKSEKGLLGAVFHPDMINSPYLYIYYTDKEDSIISRFDVTLDGGLKVDETSELEILRYSQPYANHNGGHILFGPDGYLYISSGDGGAGGDPQNHAQNRKNLLGNILRIDVNDISTDTPYHIPEDNPFKANTEGYKEEIYAYGLRNPWRFSFDEKRKLFIAADVGQDKVEEINVILNGGNYGWAKYEGSRPFKNIEAPDSIMPIFEYEHPIGQSITGGYTYYGDQLESLYGAYIYGDFVTGRIWALWIHEDMTVENVLLLETDMKISSFGLDQEGEIYVLDYRGKIYSFNEVD